MDLPGTHCEKFNSATADGFLCSCNTSKCNSIAKGKEMIAKSEKGATGEGIECHVCAGDGGVCTGESDEGSVLNCGKDITTCMLAKLSNRLFVFHNSYEKLLKTFLR